MQWLEQNFPLGGDIAAGKGRPFVSFTHSKDIARNFILGNSHGNSNPEGVILMAQSKKGLELSGGESEVLFANDGRWGVVGYDTDPTTGTTTVDLGEVE